MKRFLLSALFACIAAVAVPSCSVNSTLTGSLDDLDIAMLDGAIGADLMPVVAPDPVSCDLVLRVRNTNATVAVNGVYFPAAEVRLSSTGAHRGTIAFSSEWRGRLEPLETDTIRLRKVTSPLPVAPVPCGEFVNLVLTVRNAFPVPRTVALDSLRFECVY